MYFKIIFFGLFVAVLLSMQTFLGPHGGIVKKAGVEHAVEMNKSGKGFYTWLLDKKQKPIPNKNISCSVKFFFSDDTSVDVNLAPFAEDGFSTEESGDFYMCEITFLVMGNSISAKFENPNPIVKEGKE